MTTKSRLLSFATILIAILTLAACQSQQLTELERFQNSINKELPFKVDSLTWLQSNDIPTFYFSNPTFIADAPDAEISRDGGLFVTRTFFKESLARQDADHLWRNVVVSKKNQRVICIDRYVNGGRTTGFVYVLQSESKHFPVLGTFHWDVTDTRNIESVGLVLDDIRRSAVKRWNAPSVVAAAIPTSQSEYWKLIFHADSLFDAGQYLEAKRSYDVAFSDDRFILPIQLSTMAEKMEKIGDNQAAQAYLLHRIDMEKDFYDDPGRCPYAQLRDSFEVRQKHCNYDLTLKNELERVLERDQYDRMLWSQAAQLTPHDSLRIEQLAQRAMHTDADNLQRVMKVIGEQGFPRQTQVGTMAVQAMWLVFQHADLDHQKRFLPQWEEAVRRGDIDAAFLATLKDRIDVREGRPQRYGTQLDANGRVCPLLDASQVNLWRQEVGLPPLQ